MRSFKDYLIYRNNFSVLEMAADPHTFVSPEGEEIETTEIRRTPIFLDKDDIDYLKNFPVVFWKQALQKRWGELLYKVYLNREKDGPTVSDEQDIVIRHKSSKLVFPRVNTKINELYDRLSADPGNEIYSKMRVTGTSKDREEFLKQAEEKSKATGRRVSEYGFNFLDWIRKVDEQGKFKGGAAAGYVEPGENEIKTALSRLFHGLEYGWFDKEIGPHQKQDVDIGGNKKMKRIPVEENPRKWIEGVDFIVDNPKGKKRKPIEIQSAVPIIAPAFMVPSTRKRRNEWLLRTSKALKKDAGFDDFVKILNLEADWSDPSASLVNELEEKNAAERRKSIQEKINEVVKKIKKQGFDFDEEEDVEDSEDKKIKGLSKQLSSLRNSFIEEHKIVKLAGVLRGKYKKFLLRRYKDLISNGEDENTAKIKAFNAFLKEDAASYLEKLAERVRENSPRYDVHQWNILQYSQHHEKERPQGRLSGFGAYQPNKQQPERIYSLLVDILGKENVNQFWDHIINETDIIKNRLGGLPIIHEGIISRASNSIKEYDSIYSMFVKSISESIIDHNLNKIAADAFRQIQFKTGNVAVANYAESYKQFVINEKRNSAILPNEKKYQKSLNKLYNFARNDASNYCKQVIQLNLRFALQKWNRTFRKENPWEPSDKGYSLKDIISAFEKGESQVAELDPRTSHSIKHVKELIVTEDEMKKLKSSIEEKGMLDIASTKDSGVNQTPEQKSTNQSIFTKAVELLFDKITQLRSSVGSMFKPTPAAPIEPKAPPTKPEAEKSEVQPEVKQKRTWADIMGLFKK